MNERGPFNPFRMTRGEAAWVVALVVALLAAVGIGEVRSRRRAGPPIRVQQGDRARYAYRIDLNSADWAELTLLPGIGEATAKRIVEHREKIGGFKSLEQLAEVRGLGKARLAEIADYVTLGPAAAKPGPS